MHYRKGFHDVNLDEFEVVLGYNNFLLATLSSCGYSGAVDEFGERSCCDPAVAVPWNAHN